MRTCNVHSMVWLHGQPNPLITLGTQPQSTSKRGLTPNGKASAGTVHGAANPTVLSIGSQGEGEPGLQFTFNRIVGPTNKGREQRVDQVVDDSIIPRLLNQLANGYNVLVMTAGTAGEAAQSNGLFDRCLDYVEELPFGERDSASFGVWTMSDISCVDLVSLEAWTLAQVNDIVGGAFDQGLHPLGRDDEHVPIFDQLRGVLADGYKMPLVAVLHLVVGGKVANLVMADLMNLGAVSPVGGAGAEGAVRHGQQQQQLAHTSSCLQNFLWALDENVSGERDLAPNASFLTCFLGPFLGGDSLAALVVSVAYGDALARGSVDTVLVPVLQMATSMGRIKNRALQHTENNLLKVHGAFQLLCLLSPPSYCLLPF